MNNLDSRVRDDLFDPLDKEGLDRRAGRSSIISLGARISNLFITLLAQSILGRLVSPAEYGIFVMGMTVLGFLLIFREFGLQSAGIQKEFLTRQEASFLFWANLIVVLMLGALGLIAAPLAAKFYDEPQVSYVLTAMAFAAVLGGVSAQHTMLLRRQYRFTTIAIIDVVALIVAVFSGVAVAWWRRDVWGLIVMYVAQQATVTILTFFFVRWLPGSMKFEAGSKSLLAFGANVTAANVLYYITNNIGAIIIGGSLGTSMLGHYNRGQQVYAIPSTVLFSSVYTVIFTSLSRLKSDPYAYRDFYVSALKRVSLFYMWLSGCLIFAGDDVIRVLLGPGWEIAGTVLNIFAIALVGSGMAQLSGMLYQSQGRLREFQIWSLIDSCIRISAVIVASHWGIYGFAFGFALTTTFITAPAAIWFAGQKGPVSFGDQTKAIAPSLAIFLFSFAGSALGQYLSPFTDAGMGTLLLEGMGSLFFVILIGFAIPSTRRTYLEVIRGIRSIA